MIHTGAGPSHLNNFIGECNIPPLSESTIKKYCKLVIIRHVPIFAIFVSARNDEITYWRIINLVYIYHWLFEANSLACENSTIIVIK